MNPVGTQQAPYQFTFFCILMEENDDGKFIQFLKRCHGVSMLSLYCSEAFSYSSMKHAVFGENFASHTMKTENQ